MQYRILLSNLLTQKTAETIVPTRLSLEDFSVKIKLALQLPYSDEGLHYYELQGVTYMREDLQLLDSEMRFENANTERRYRNSEKVRLSQMFTVLQSSFLYKQAGATFTYSVRCTLIERM